MSLKRYLKLPEVIATIRPLRPKCARQIAAAIQVPPRSKRYSLVGNAFDYLLWFEIQRRAPYATVRSWAVEHAPDFFFHSMTHAGGGRSEMCPDPKTLAILEPMESDPFVTAKKLSDRAHKIVDDAKLARTAFVAEKNPSSAILKDVARHAFRLAKLEPVVRASHVEPTIFDEPTSDDISELVDLLSVVPFEKLLHQKILLLNPMFGVSSKVVEGADADLISGDRLIDFKTKMEGKIEAGELDQLFGYFLLATNEKESDMRLPEINEVAIYFSRHGYLWSMKTSLWTEKPGFSSIQKWFFDHAREVFPNN
jgi:hypothetical protein